MTAITTPTPLTRTVDGAEVPAAGTYALDVAHSSIGFSVRHLMVSKTKGRFDDFAGTVTIAEAPQQDCDFARIRELAGLDLMQADFAARGLRLSVIDLRREAVTFADGVITERRALPGDPLGYREVDLGVHSFFVGSGLDANGFRGADYDPGPTPRRTRSSRCPARASAGAGP